MKTDLVISGCDGVLIDSAVISARRQVAPPGLALDTALILGGCRCSWCWPLSATGWT
jgi:hypothetical protein